MSSHSTRMAVLAEEVLLAKIVKGHLIVRKSAVGLVLLGTPLQNLQRRLLGRFGIRGVGSLYYLSYVLARDSPASLISPLIDATLATVAASIIVHGVSATPVIQRYSLVRLRRRTQTSGEA